jgi:6-phosphogluconolactonase
MTSGAAPRWREFRERDEFEAAARRYILDAAERAIAARGVFRIVLAGGATPRRLYRSLRDAATDWAAWDIHFGDERCLPADDPARNSRMAASAWLDHVPVAPERLHVIPGELGPEDAARRYTGTLADAGVFDVVLLGLGTDGHTASLFPGDAWAARQEMPDAMPVFAAPKAPSRRVSLSPARLSRARHVLFLVAGADKDAALAAWRTGADLPASRIRPAHGVDVYRLVEAPLP